MNKLAAMLLFPMFVLAEPGPVTQYLITERATLLDIGMLRLEVLTTEFEKRVGLFWMDEGQMKMFRAEVNTDYEPDDDKIYIYISAMNSEANEAQMEEGCAYAINHLGIWLSKSLPGLFLHEGFEDPGQPPDLYNAFREMIELRCYFSTESSTSEGRFWGYRLLAEQEMTIGRWKID